MHRKADLDVAVLGSIRAAFKQDIYTMLYCSCRVSDLGGA